MIRQKARSVTADLIALYTNRPDTALGRTSLKSYQKQIIDGKDLLSLAESELLETLDKRVSTLISTSARRVSVVTALSPRLFIDVLFVLVECTKLVRAIAMLYGAKPGMFSAVSLVRQVLAHVALTGTLAAGDSLIGQVVGHGLAARLSHRLGEGVVNGILTARVGLAAMHAIRPLPFLASKPPSLGKVTAGIANFAKKQSKEKEV
jgi:putative membrane protein